MKSILHITLLIALAAAFTACHSNEANYKAAYDKAMERYKEGIGKETYDKIRAEATRNTHFIAGDSLRMVTMPANVYLDSASVGQPYSVIIASFKQQFNAKTLRDRLRTEEGLPAYILFGGPERKYYVAAKGFDNEELAAVFVHNIDKRVKIKVLEPKAWIMHRP